jgi:DNA-binding IscR family transcriptional regulator
MNSRFAVAVHILTLLEQGGGAPMTSEYVAGSVNTNPSLVRRMLGSMARAGLTTSQFGAGGGALLARPADQITLGDVYRAVDAGDLFGMHREGPNPACPVGRHIQGVLETRISAAERALQAELDRSTIADLGRDVALREERRDGLKEAC